MTGPETNRDLRLVPLAATGWAAAWLGNGGTLVGWAVGAGGVLVVVGVSATRRSAGLGAVAVLMAALILGGGLRAHQLGAGPVARLAADQATVDVELQLRTDLHVTSGEGIRSGYGTARAELSQLSGRGTTWRVREPVLLVVSGSALEAWARLPVGTTVSTPGRLSARDPGDDIAAVLRVRGAADIRAPPSAPLRLVEQVRQGLRESVSHRRPEPRALVPALVLGDTSAVTPGLVEDFRSTGLTHLRVRFVHGKNRRCRWHLRTNQR